MTFVTYIASKLLLPFILQLLVVYLRKIEVLKKARFVIGSLVIWCLTITYYFPQLLILVSILFVILGLIIGTFYPPIKKKSLFLIGILGMLVGAFIVLIGMSSTYETYTFQYNNQDYRVFERRTHIGFLLHWVDFYDRTLYRQNQPLFRVAHKKFEFRDVPWMMWEQDESNRDVSKEYMESQWGVSD